VRDIRYAVRYLRNSSGTAAMAILSLALGMMAATALYSVIHAVVIDPFPYKDVDSLMSVRVQAIGQRGGRTGYTPDQFLEIAERNTIFEGVIASTISDVLWTDQAEPKRLRGNYGTPNTFQVMGVPPLAGRVFGPADVSPGASPVAVLGYRFWQQQFGGDATVVGRVLRLNGVRRTVVGVMPKRFMWRGADVYLPIVLRRGEIVEGVQGVHLLGRLKPNVTDAHAEADLRPIIADLKRREPTQFPDSWRVGLLSFKETFPSSIRQNLWIMFGAVGLLLLIACANVSNLLLAKATGRQKEMTIRAALGAGRSAIVRQLLVESLIVACVAGVLGIALASVGLRAILALVPPDTIPDEAEITLNTPVLLFSLAVSVVTSVVFGLAPALHAVSRDVASALRETGRSLTGGRTHAIVRKVLVIVEVALALMLSVAAGLMIRTVLAVEQSDIAFRPEQVLTFRVPLSDARYPSRDQRVAFFEELLRRVQAIPGVKAAGVNTSVHPLGNITTRVDVVGGMEGPGTMLHQTSAGYFTAFGATLLHGRLLSDEDVQRADAVAVVNEAFVRTRMANLDPIGRFVKIPLLSRKPFDSPRDTFQIVGIVRDRLNTMDGTENGLDPAAFPEVYVPYTLTARSSVVAVLASGDPAAITRAAVGQVYAIDPDQPAMLVQTVDRYLREQAYAGPRFNVALFSVFAALGLILSIVGIYGVMSSAVAQQVHEMGVRLAIGASPTAVFAMILGRAARLLIAGVAIGIIGGLFASRLLAGYVWHAATFDPLTLSCVSVLLFGAGVLACVAPARRAAHISPLIALRQE
jgi:putative ABC transport system permease protein